MIKTYGKNRLISFVMTDVIILMAACIIFFSYYWSNEQTKYFLYVIVAMSVVVFVLSLLESNYKIHFTFVLTITGALAYSFAFMRNLPLLAVFVSSLMFLFYMYQQGLDKGNFRVLYFCCTILAVQALYMSAQPGSLYLRSRMLVLAFKNPNMTGIILYNLAVILLTGVFYSKKKWCKVLFAFLGFLMCCLTIWTLNRGSILALIVFALVVPAYVKQIKACGALRVILIVFPWIAMFLYSSLLHVIPIDAMLFNKPFFSGRQILWRECIESILSNPFSIKSYETGGLNLVLSGLYQLGIIAVTGYFMFINTLKPLFSFSNRITFQVVGYIGFLCIFVQQAFESTLIYGSYGVYIFSYLLLGISCSNTRRTGF